MSGTGQSDPIAHDVRPICLHRPNVRRGDFCASHSVDELQSGNGAALVVGTQYDPAKNAIAQNSGYRKTDAISLLFKYERRLLSFIELRQANIGINPRQKRCAFREAKFEYSIEIARRDWADCRLSTPRNSPLLIQDAAFHRTSWPAEGDRISKIEVTSGFNQSEIHSRSTGIGNNLLNPSNRKIAARLGYFARFVVDYPVANAGFNATEILTGKLILFSGTVIVDRVRSMDEYPKSHDLRVAASPERRQRLNRHRPLLPLDRPGRLAGHVVHHPVHALHLIDDARGGLAQKLHVELVEVRGHAVG